MHFEMSSEICFSLDQSEILSLGNGLNVSKCTGVKQKIGDQKYPDSLFHVYLSPAV